MLGLFRERQHTTSVRTLTHADLYKLPADDFTRIVKDYPAQGLAVADAAHTHLKAVHAKLVARRLYELAGMPDLVRTLFHKSRTAQHIKGWKGHFRVAGVAQRIKELHARVVHGMAPIARNSFS